MITAYRIFNSVHSAAWNDGEGAFRFGGRWNSKGTRLLYTSASLALSTLEILVHLDDDELLSDYSYASLSFEDRLVKPLEEVAELPAEWGQYPIPDITRQIGDVWVRSNVSAILRVPSVVIPKEFNYLINLDHAAARRIKYGAVESFVLDRRFIEKKSRKQ